jgi:hypothetical protein
MGDGHLDDSAAAAALEIPQVKVGQTRHDPRESHVRLTVGTKGALDCDKDGPAVVDLSSGTTHPQLSGRKQSAEPKTVSTDLRPDPFVGRDLPASGHDHMHGLCVS